MRIEIKEKGTPEFYKEVVDVSAQYLRLMKKPESKLKDTFKMLKGYIALCTVFLALVLITGFAWGLDALTLVVAVVVLAVNKGRVQEILEYIRDHQVDVRII